MRLRIRARIARPVATRREDQQRRIPDQRRSHWPRLACALIASSRTSPQISSTLSTKPFDLKTCGSVLSNFVSTKALIRPGRADITATRSARHRFLDVVRDKNHGLRRPLPDVQKLRLHQAAGLRIKRAERLVHQQDLRIEGEGAGDRGPLLHPAGQLRRIAVLEAGEPDHVDEGLRAPLAFASREAACARGHRGRWPSRSSTGTARSAGIRRRGRVPGRRQACHRSGCCR